MHIFQDLAGGAHGIVDRTGLICNLHFFNVFAFVLILRKKSKITTSLRFNAQIYIVFFYSICKRRIESVPRYTPCNLLLKSVDIETDMTEKTPAGAVEK